MSTIKRCADCEHCRVSGRGVQQRAWCRMGMWSTTYLQPSRPGHLFSYRTLRSILKPFTDRLAKIAADCPFYASMDDEPTLWKTGQGHYEPKPK